MKYTIFGVDQLKAVEYGLKLPECLILTWAKGIVGKSFSFSYESNGNAFYWLKVDQFMIDYPVIQIEKESVLKKLKKLSNDGFFLKESKTIPGGNFGYYSPTPKFDSLFHNSHKTKIQEEKPAAESHPQKNTGEQSHLEIKTGGLETKTGGLEKIPTIPSNYNPSNTTPPTSDSQSQTQLVFKTEEKEKCYRWLKTTLDMVPDKDIVKIIKTHGVEGVRGIHAQYVIDRNSSRTKLGLGVLHHRLMTLQAGKTGAEEPTNKPKTQAERIADTQERYKKGKASSPKHIFDNPESQKTTSNAHELYLKEIGEE